MPNRICRRLLALALAYVLALDPVLPALSAAALIGDIGGPGGGEICASKWPRAGSSADSPLDHGRCCAIGAGCVMAGCAAALPAADVGGAIILALHSAPPLVPVRGAAALPRTSRANSARAPPRA
jgi:hypothetical protein